ncbi:MAG: DNA repair protein RecN [Desulfobacteraceae bacterium]|uniref:DNA repair protein RecN n=1 Tax=Candidatus Desulfaltia bathyphila TaxID=2841697 RepID=A0A8J6N6I6_9BACT|nr:DNA repair protein RecN [Candidatus Desulfaltia bathyphila]MBL7195936.1 DNA repair protein RecN [Desulfobacterales bacterium]
MLRELSIKNFTIIDKLNINFLNGLTILSGETGAGKSIIINAVNLLLGGKATAKLIRTGSEAAELEALFQITPGSRLAKIMKEKGFDESEELVIRRIISRKARHRIYINGRLATIQMLNSITENLVSISGQHAHQGLLKEDQHLLILDQFGGLMPQRAEVYRYYHEIVPMIRMLQELKAAADQQDEHIKLLEFQKKEIIDTSINPGEDKALEQKRNRLKNGEALYQAVHSSIEDLYSTEGAIVERVVEVKKRLEKAGLIDPALTEQTERLTKSIFNLEDIAEGLREYQKNIEMDEGLLEEVEERLDTLHKLKRKYGGSLEAIFAYLESIDQKLSKIANLSENIAETEAKLDTLHAKLVRSAENLSKKRKQVADILAKKVEKELSFLEMSQTKFKISLESMPPINARIEENINPYLTYDNKAVSETGIDRATFMIAPNVGEVLKPLSSIVSGGELSRVVLALKAILAKTESVETVVFDEVDAGIGGSVAEVVGKKLFSLARYHQVICITHLPQIAKFGDYHFRISKHVSRGRTITGIRPLDNKERVKEIARMLGGVEITRATLDHAHEMLDKAVSRPLDKRSNK